AGVPKNWTVTISETGWTNNQLGLIWLKDVFEPNTRNTTGAKRLLIMDGHSSHCTEPFECYAREHNIIPLWLPSHSSHILQPLDVAVFSSVKRRFRDGVQDLIRNGQNHVTNDDFLRIYAKLRPAALSNSNIKSAFRATGIFPFDPEEVLAKLGEFNLSTPPPVLLSSSVNSVSNTPRTVRQVEKQQTAIKLRQHQLKRQYNRKNGQVSQNSQDSFAESFHLERTNQRIASQQRQAGQKAQYQGQIYYSKRESYSW
ncbi:DDE-domain-containing protein, partial [Zopfia rhizophila CBS 207.26]